MAELLRPQKIGGVEIKNRVFLPSMCLYYSDEEGGITDKLRAFYEKRAEAGVGAFIIGANPFGKNKWARPSIADDDKIPQWIEFNNLMHRYGSKIFCQLHPSGIQFGRKEFKESPLDMTTGQVDNLITQYAEGALRAKKAGFDGVEIHGAHGHEVATFLSQVLNKRNDKYGGGLEGHARIVTDMIRLIKEKCGKDFPLILRISGEERIPGGRELPETISICKLAVLAGADAIHVSVGMPDSEEWECAASEIPQGYLAWMGKEMKQALSVPVILVGRIVDWEVGEKIVIEGEADFIAVGRAMLADAEWMKTIESQDQKPHRVCLGCNQGCRTKRANEKTLATCFQNPQLGYEELNIIGNPGDRKKFCVIGAGLSGMEAAKILALKGHDVTLYEKDTSLGGTFKDALLPPGKNNYVNLINFYKHALKEAGVKIVFGKEVCKPEDIEGEFDKIIVAVGGTPIVPNLDFTGKKMYMAQNLLRMDEVPEGEYVVIGDGLTGYDVADFLIGKEKKVTIIGNSESEIEDVMGISRWRFMKERFSNGEVSIISDSLVTGIGPDGFIIKDSSGKELKTTGDFIFVLACGFRTNSGLYELLKKEGLDVEIIGTAKAMYNGMEALHDAYNLVVNI